MPDEETPGGFEGEGDSPEDSPETVEPTDEDADPVLTRLEALEQQFAGLRGLDPNRINPALGRIAALQSEIAELKKVPAATQDTAHYDAALQRMARVLTNSPLVDDSDKTEVRAILDEFTTAATRRQRDELREELLNEVRQTAKDTTAEIESVVPDTEVTALNARLFGYSEAKGVAWEDIPAETFRWLANENSRDAELRVKRVIDGLAADVSSAERTATRRRAAGNGTPTRAGNNTLEADRQRLERDGLPLTETAARKRIAESLGIDLPA